MHVRDPPKPRSSDHMWGLWWWYVEPDFSLKLPCFCRLSKWNLWSCLEFAKDQTPFHKSFTLSWLLSCLYSSISPFKNLYPDLQVYLPSPVIAQKILSSNSLRPKGIFLMDEVSCGVNMPSIMFVLLGKNSNPLNVYVWYNYQVIAILWKKKKKNLASTI